MAEKKRYVVRHGRRFGQSKQFGPGDFVYLTDAEYVGLEDMLTPAPEPEPEPQPAPAPEPSPDAGLDKLTVAELTEMAKTLEISGTSGMNKAQLIEAIEAAAKSSE
ncbi:MAG: Rho termination factor N-terminal domain-containing protein [Caldilineaceae bacterium]|nr:Rho termination factor N-terminal domain-containing protein [Caldilineaceae bacterium]